MTARRALCVSQDRAVAPVIAAALAEAGLIVEQCAALPAHVGDAAVVVIDGPARRAAGNRLRHVGAPVVVVGDDLGDRSLIELMSEAPVSHAVADPADPTLAVTSRKLASGDVFGLEKYLAPATAVHEREVTGELAKRRAMAEVCTWAESAGARRGVVHRVASVVDELVMNALRGGGPATVRWAADPTTLAVSVADPHGALRQREIIDHVLRARSERGRPEAEDGSGAGAGLGLYLVLANVAALVVNVDPGARTEVVCLFDVGRGRLPALSAVRSLHVFGGA